MNRLTTFFLMTILLILVSCMDPEMNEPGMSPKIVDYADVEVLPSIEIIEAERGTFTVVIPSPFPGDSPMTVDFSHRIKVQVQNRDIFALLLETDQTDFRFATASALFFGNFDLGSIPENTFITAGTETFVYPENKSASASISNFTITKSEIIFINDSGSLETNESVENTMFSNL